MSGYSTLTPSQIERLALLSEECGEVVQAANKVIRHGYESYHPDNPLETNRSLLYREVVDLTVAISLMVKDLPPLPEEDFDSVLSKKMRYCHYQGG